MKKFIKNLFKDVIENKEYNDSYIQKYFSETYVQTVNNEKLDFESFKKHILKLKSKVINQNVEFQKILSNRNTIFTKHIVTSTLKNKEIVKHKVFAEFTLNKEMKIIKCDEITLLVEGNENQNNLGSEF